MSYKLNIDYVLVANEDGQIEQKLNYLHFNPVKAMIVELPQQYIFSSAKDYCGEKGMVNIELIR